MPELYIKLPINECDFVRCASCGKGIDLSAALPTIWNKYVCADCIDVEKYNEWELYNMEEENTYVN